MTNPPETPSIRCPVCRNASYNPNDIREGYCGRCHAWTSPAPIPWQASPEVLAALRTSPADAGPSTCPICGVTWTVTPAADCLLPACGCYGADTGPANPARPCEPCGLAHAFTCGKMPTRARP